MAGSTRRAVGHRVRHRRVRRGAHHHRTSRALAGHRLPPGGPAAAGAQLCHPAEGRTRTLGDVISTESGAVHHRPALPRWWPQVAVAAFAAGVLSLVSSHVPVRGDSRALDALGYVLLVLVG